VGARRKEEFVMSPSPRESHPRYPVQKIVSYRYQSDSVMTLTLDLGEGGMRIKTEHPLARGVSLRFKIFLGANSVWATGRIVDYRSAADGEAVYEIHFTELTGQDRHLLQTYLATLGDLDTLPPILPLNS
jgi:hypothetical protein